MASPRLGSFFSENKTFAGFELCPFSRSGFLKGFFGGNGTGVEAANAAVYAIAIDNTAARTASSRRIFVLLDGKSGHALLFAFNAFNALAQPTLTSSLCCFRHPIILPPPGAMPGHILSASALQRASGVAACAARIDPGNEIAASESKKAAVNRRISISTSFLWSGLHPICVRQGFEVGPWANTVAFLNK
jgi:hypothetical protein